MAWHGIYVDDRKSLRHFDTILGRQRQAKPYYAAQTLLSGSTAYLEERVHFDAVDNTE